MAYGTRRRRPSFGTKRKTTKIRNPIRVKERTAKKGGKCAACRMRFEPGDPVTVVNVKRRTYHRNGCVPLNVGMPAAGGGPMPVMDAAQVAKAFSINWSAGEAKMVGLLGLENAMAVMGKLGIIKDTPEVEKAFDRYNKCKASAMRPGSDQEGKQAMVLAATSLIKIVFNS
jgi:hypothetical protein